ncbi:hypothetical protein [Aquimarina sp. RZ0]|uniref:hypothetical protein n=1 Tax=Aquimarina sp. RZ0 TaxID=2607730 RepID=UPI00165F3870|nr:hypothetical protein [Aquimarina sp. RZ0]
MKNKFQAQKLKLTKLNITKLSKDASIKVIGGTAGPGCGEKTVDEPGCPGNNAFTKKC